MNNTSITEDFQHFDTIHRSLTVTKQQDFLLKLYASLAKHNASANLLNCYIREYALTVNEFNANASVVNAPLVLQTDAACSQLVQLQFPQSTARLLVRADRISLLGRCRFSSAPYLKEKGKPWRLLDAHDLCQFLLQHLANCLDCDFNYELLEQVDNSIQATQAFLSRRSDTLPFADTFLQAEQNLIWGHAMHPAPKSRHGVAMDDMLACSPEVFSSFPLYWFRVAPKLIDIQGDADWSPMTLFSALHGKDELLYPCHPWEVYTIMRQSKVRAAIADGLITPIGFIGKNLAPTSSVRTLYHPELTAQFKFSIHVRLTNCVRKNAWYELESAVALTRLLKPIKDTAAYNFPQFELMPEPMASTLNLGDKDCQESFGILYRENIPQSQRLQYSPTLVASLFAWDNDGESVLVKRIKKISKHNGCNYETTVKQWLHSYLHCLLPAVLHYFFEHGVVFEPHLQNVLIGFEDDLPSRVWVRDLEGTKLLPEKWPTEKLNDLSERARTSIYYSREQGWRRIAYCALVNNISEGIFHGAMGDLTLEKSLWLQVYELITDWQSKHGIEPELQDLVQGGSIPSKNNFTTRLLKQADSASSYTFLRNPMVNA